MIWWLLIHEMYVCTIIVEEKKTDIFSFLVRKDLSESRKFNDIYILEV